MESARIAMSPPQRALAEGPFMPISSRELREGLLDASPKELGNTIYRVTPKGQQNGGRLGLSVRADSPDPRQGWSRATPLLRQHDTPRRIRWPDGSRAGAAREASRGEPATPHPEHWPGGKSDCPRAPTRH